MRNVLMFGLMLAGMFALLTTEANAARPVDLDGDGYSDRKDCDDTDASVYPGAIEVCFDGIDNNCDGLIDGADPTCGSTACIDQDGDGYGLSGDPTCTYSEVDCDDNLNYINPGATEVCDNGLDDDCNGLADGSDPYCGDDPHLANSWENYPLDCIGCHATQFEDMAASTHYTWVGQTTEMANQNGTPQGKLTNAVNSYCINIIGNWTLCGKCHVGRGLRPDDSMADNMNIDCLMCHNEEYGQVRTRLADGRMAPPLAATPDPTPSDLLTLDGYTQNISKPTRTACLKCHAFAGGGNGVKRGDLSMSGSDLYGNSLQEGSDNNTDPYFDVHMDAAGPDITCQQCHVFSEHKTIGRGSDLRPTDDLTRGAELSCATCHVGFDIPGGHSAAGANRTDADRHVTKVSCQACHIDSYAKVATELSRDWRYNHEGLPADGTYGPGHPELTIADNLAPTYRFWNRMSDNYLLGDSAVLNPETGSTYSTSRPVGDINNGKLYPFKYKTAVQPMIVDGSILLPLDTYEYLSISGDVNKAVRSGLVNLGLDPSEPVEFVTTDTYQLITHGVAPAAAVDCQKCHQSLDVTTDSELDLLGYALKGASSQVCAQCHREKRVKSSHDSMHNHINKGAGMDCLFCHTFSRQAERGGISPCDPNANEFVDNIPFEHLECN